MLDRMGWGGGSVGYRVGWGGEVAVLDRMEWGGGNFG